MKSWKTSVIGICTGLILIATQVIAILDGDPATAFEISQFFAGLGALGIGVFARDNDKTSEQAGAKTWGS